MQTVSKQNRFYAKMTHGSEAANCERMPITVDTLEIDLEIELLTLVSENSCQLSLHGIHIVFI